MAVTVTFTDNFDEVMHLLDTAKRRALAVIGATVQEDAVKNSPKRTGALQESWTVEVNDEESWVKIGVPLEALPKGKKTPNYERDNYAKYVESGTSKMAGRHMLRNAVNDNLSQFPGVVKSEMENVW